jgi:hypothetical protein
MAKFFTVEIRIGDWYGEIENVPGEDEDDAMNAVFFTHEKYGIDVYNARKEHGS